MEITKQGRHRYNSIVIILHWLMAIGFLLMLGSGVAMKYGDLEQSLVFQMYQWHKGGGVLLLLAVGLRIIVRIVSMAQGTVPSLPDTFPVFEKMAAHAGHAGLYFCMLAMPLSGWVMVSASIYGLPTIVFGLFEWPHIPGLEGKEQVEEGAETLHFIFAILFALLIAGHIAAVIKHAMIDHENLLRRMWWSKPRP